MNKEIVLITGADGGIGLAMIQEFLELGVSKIYATGLNIEKLNKIKEFNPNVIFPIELDVTNLDQIKNCVKKSSDTTILINNAAIELKIPFLEKGSNEAALKEMQVNYISLINMINEFLPILENNKPSKIVNILSLASLVIVKRLATYCATKSAGHILTETIREELKEKNIHVAGVYMGYVNTKMVPEKVAYEKSEPKEIAQEICKGIIQNINHIIPDKMAKEYINKYPINTQFFL